MTNSKILTLVTEESAEVETAVHPLYVALETQLETECRAICDADGKLAAEIARGEADEVLCLLEAGLDYLRAMPPEQVRAFTAAVSAYAAAANAGADWI
jgi:Tat protein secretion system quality control protein TatD with DNase activity